MKKYTSKNLIVILSLVLIMLLSVVSCNRNNKTEIITIPQTIQIPPTTTAAPTKAKPTYNNKFDTLRQLYNNNSDIIGIVKIPGTVVFYPVAYSNEDNNYYLNRNYFKQQSATGSIFMDFENSVERHDPSTILYGHQMSGDSMFHTLGYFKDEKYFNEHKYIIFNNIYEDNAWEIFTAFETNIDFNYIQVYFNSEREFLNLAEEMRVKSYFDSGITINEGDRILVLSTCTNKDPNTRYVLAGRMVKNRDNIPKDILSQMDSVIADFAR